MFTSRLLVALALSLAAVAALPTDKPEAQYPNPVTTITDDDIDDGSWFSFPMFGNLFAPLWRLFPTFAEVGPKIVVDDNKFQVIVNVKDYKKEDLKVKVKGYFIIIQGVHETKHDEHDLFASQFFHTYTLPVNASGADVTAELSSDGYLVVSAPVNAEKKSEEVDRDVPITESGSPLQKDEPKPTTQSVLTENEDDRKEPTTPASDRDQPDKDSRINEVVPI